MSCDWCHQCAERIKGKGTYRRNLVHAVLDPPHQPSFDEPNARHLVPTKNLDDRQRRHDLVALDMFQEGFEIRLVCGEKRRRRREEPEDERVEVWIVRTVLA